MPFKDRETKLAYDRRYRREHPYQAEAARQRWRDKMHDRGLCTRCGGDIWLYNDGLGRAICGTCQTVKEWGRAAYDEAGENPPLPLSPV
jgi:hypothetical protein